MVDEPSDVCYSLPPDSVDKSFLHYVLVQVSKHRYVVAEYGGGGRNPSSVINVMNYRVVSKPMRFSDALDHAKELRERREK